MTARQKADLAERERQRHAGAVMDARYVLEEFVRSYRQFGGRKATGSVAEALEDKVRELILDDEAYMEAAAKLWLEQVIQNTHPTQAIDMSVGAQEVNRIRPRDRG